MDRANDTSQNCFDHTQFGRESKVWLDMKSCGICPTRPEAVSYVLTIWLISSVATPIKRASLCNKRRELLPFVRVFKHGN